MKLFRVEAMHHSQPSQDGHDPLAEARHRELLDEIASIKALMQAGVKVAGQADGPDAAGASAAGTHAELEISHLKAEMLHAQQLKVELDAMYHAITQTKQEIASLHSTSFGGDQMSKVTDELDEVVMGTESATERILSAVETIDETANNLIARLDGQSQDMAADIQEKVVSIYEACNFQDITGQRITKVVAALRYVEERVSRMMDIWGGIDSFKDMAVEPAKERSSDAALLNGPSLPSDDDVASQEDIDALFA